MLKQSVLIGSLILVSGCARPAPRQTAHLSETITVATTTSLQDSGLLDVLVPLFEKQSGIKAKVVATGSGQALELGRRGDADVLLAHSPAAEKQFVDEGYGVDRKQIMWNDFVIVGPEDDPAGVRKLKAVTEAFAKIAEAKARFVSRGDESGTHVKEKAIWSQAGVQPQGDWYIRAGAGMAAALRIAGEKQAYCLTDRSTFLSQRDRLRLAILNEGDPLLRNVYSVILINPEKHPHVKHEAAKKFADFFASPEAKRIIAEFGKDKFGQPLFRTMNE
jgi:tungstate transport system substrate-binding protein